MTAIILVAGLSTVAGAGCVQKPGFECKATYSAGGTPQTFVFEEIRDPLAARDKCLAMAKDKKPAGATQISCECKTR